MSEFISKKWECRYFSEAVVIVFNVLLEKKRSRSLLQYTLTEELQTVNQGQL